MNGVNDEMQNVPKRENLLTLPSGGLLSRALDVSKDSHRALPRNHLVKPDLLIECSEAETDGHSHLVHTFPLYLLGVYWHKAILFANRDGRRPLVDLRRLKLPFRCDIVKELINFAYDGTLSNSVTVDNFDELLTAADYTMSTRMVAHLAELEKHLFPGEEKQKQDEERAYPLVTAMPVAPDREPSQREPLIRGNCGAVL